MTSMCGTQSWALLEEDVGAIQRAEELRSFRQQRRTELVLPREFADPDMVLEPAPVFAQIAAWFKQNEVRPHYCTQTPCVMRSGRRHHQLCAAQASPATRRNSPPAPRFLAPVGDARIRADLDNSNGAQSQQFSVMFGGEEYRKMVSLNEVEDCMGIA